jgi:hypothetical protein
MGGTSRGDSRPAQIAVLLIPLSLFITTIALKMRRGSRHKARVNGAPRKVAAAGVALDARLKEKRSTEGKEQDRERERERDDE